MCDFITLSPAQVNQTGVAARRLRISWKSDTPMDSTVSGTMKMSRKVWYSVKLGCSLAVRTR